MNEVIAIDGPSAAGKSTVARGVAQIMGYLYVDSGALYRIVTWQCLAQGVDTADAEAVARFAESLVVEQTVRNGAVEFAVNGVPPGEAIRMPEINQHVSPVATVPGVRDRVTAWLRGMRQLGPLVVEGRDIGSVVFPDTQASFYLDASATERARRRHSEEQDKGIQESREEVLASLMNRDRIDSGRKAAPLKVADGAMVVDTTPLSIREVIESILDHLPAEFRTIAAE